ncbi:MAG: SLBB domain-containing protein [Leptolyngbyaceae cyanobacterium bins.59]|nr:SLBB domain-containing protein [Leptolyngbyaceae cyanobacterium bins.59]
MTPSSGKSIQRSISSLVLLGTMGLVSFPVPGHTQSTLTNPDGSLPPSAQPTPTVPLGSPPTSTPRRSISFPLPPVQPVRTAAPIQVEDGYILGPGDRIRIVIFNVDEYSGESQVLADGTLNLALVGSVPVSGMSIKQAATDLEKRYSRFLKRPLITITLVNARPLNIAIAGEVNRPGSYTITPITAASPGASFPTVTRMLQQAGGITQAANVREIQIRRVRTRDKGKEQTITVDLWRLLQEGDLSQDILLRDGDTVFVPTNTEVSLTEATQLANANFASSDSRPLSIAIIGEVARPGPYRVPIDAQSKVPTVTRAIQLAGGITQSADIRKIQVRRQTKTGTDKLIDVDFWKLLKSGDVRQDIPLQDGDTVVIPIATALSSSEAIELAAASFSPDKITVNVVGEVNRPGAIQVPPNTPLNQALLAAGGFNNKADSGSVQLVRLNPNGTVTKLDLPVNYAQGVNETTNPALRNNDTVIVNRSGIVAFGEGAGTILGPILSPFTAVFGLFRLLGL